MSETPTPRTDANGVSIDQMGCESVSANFARQPERENITLRNAQKICEDCDGPTMEKFKQLERELSEAKQKVEALTSMFRHYHVNNGSNDVCKSCGLDLRDSVHIRITKQREQSGLMNQ